MCIRTFPTCTIVTSIKGRVRPVGVDSGDGFAADPLT